MWKTVKLLVTTKMYSVVVGCVKLSGITKKKKRHLYFSVRVAPCMYIYKYVYIHMTYNLHMVQRARNLFFIFHEIVLP